MNKAIVAFVIALAVGGCEDKKYAAWYFRGDAENLKVLQVEWVREGRPAGFAATNFMGADNEYFDYTNTIALTNGVYHCRFAAHNPAMPGGLEAITEDGVVLWIPDRGGKVAVSPERYGAEK